MKKWWKSKKATKVYWSPSQGMYVCVYHKTPVVKWNDKWIILNSGGFRTVTTKRRMNEVSEIYDLGFDVSQSNFEWWLTLSENLLAHTSNKLSKGGTLPFEDGVKIRRL